MKLSRSTWFYLDFMILMVALGSSDALRGVFAPVFKSHFQLDPRDHSLIITVSYLGNLCFLLIGSRSADSFGIRRIFVFSIILWMIALALYILTDSFAALLIGIFLAMGTSTLLNILMNIMSPLVFAAPSMIINTLFFVQGIGTTFTQSAISSTVSNFDHWKLVNLILIIVGVVAVALFFRISKNIEKNQSNFQPKQTVSTHKVEFKKIINNRSFWFLSLIFGCYFIAEHGILNWMNLYGIEILNLDQAKSATYPALFFGGLTLGRLILSKIVAIMGIIKSLSLFMTIGTVTYVTSFVLGGSWLYLLALSGFSLSIVYPTLTLGIQLFFPQNSVATAVGAIMAVGTIFDVLFNSFFGTIIVCFGFANGMMLLPFSLIVCTALFLIFNVQQKPLRLLA